MKTNAYFQLLLGLYLLISAKLQHRHNQLLQNCQKFCEVTLEESSFGGAEVACWPLISKFMGSNLAEAVGFLKGDKNPQHAFLREGSKIIGPMSQICGM